MKLRSSRPTFSIFFLVVVRSLANEERSPLLFDGWLLLHE